jgi:acyl carrier protein
MNNVVSVVRSVLARHAGVRPGSVRAWQTLEKDLGLDPLEMILVGLDIEQAFGLELCTDGFSSLETVGDVFSFVAGTVGDEHPRRVHERTVGGARSNLCPR